MEKVLRKGLLCLGLTVFSLITFGQSSDIVGQVMYNNSFPMDDVHAYLVDSTGTVIDSAITDASGEYEFNNLPNGTYTITFSTDEEPGGITLTDAFMVMLHLFNPNLFPFTPFQEMLADVNSDGAVWWNDYYEIIYQYLNQGNPFSGGDWDFEPTVINVNGGNRDLFTTSTSGGSNGDVNGTFQPPKYGNCFISNECVQNLIAEKSETVSLRLACGEAHEIAGMHIVITVPAGITVESVESDLADLHISKAGDEIRLTWMSIDQPAIQFGPSKPLVEFIVTSNASLTGGEPLYLSLQSESHFIGASGEMLPFVHLTLPGVVFSEKNPIIVNETVYPNPFITSATLDYVLPSDGSVRIFIVNNAGQVIQVVLDEYQVAGAQRVNIDGSNWPSGIYHYIIEFSGKGIIVKKGSMIKSK